ncbi:hypothetical protein EVAR_71629_1 [Eumeta japonica]|uniref:Uncharacterized protein n=1 Tax=Eumeta variegata TaxID=151549 RepID=A0A4C2AA10_EUMVA|nr:hypothetical protein EVAR_71629_1 [Eumeta japonica]
MLIEAEAHASPQDQCNVRTSLGVVASPRSHVLHAETCKIRGAFGVISQRSDVPPLCCALGRHPARIKVVSEAYKIVSSRVGRLSHAATSSSWSTLVNFSSQMLSVLRTMPNTNTNATYELLFCNIYQSPRFF